MERYQSLGTLDNDLYLDGSPVIISAGRLLKDSEDGRVLVQLKIKNIYNSQLSFCKVCVKAYDPSGAEITGVEAFPYLDLSVDPNQDFGSKTPIYLPVNMTRLVKVGVIEATYKNGFVWKTEYREWKPFPKAVPISSEIKDPDLVNEFLQETKLNKAYIPQMVGIVFQCSCGERSIGSKCNVCNRNYNELKQIYDVEKLSHNREKRINNEKALQEQAREKKYQELIRRIDKAQTEWDYSDIMDGFSQLKDYKESKKYASLMDNKIYEIKEEKRREEAKKKKTKILLISVLVIVIIGIIILTRVLKNNDLKQRYALGNSYLTEGKYIEANEIFTNLEDYLDSTELADKALYELACKDIDEKNFYEGIQILEQLSDYEPATNKQTDALSLWQEEVLVYLKNGELDNANTELQKMPSSEKKDELFSLYDLFYKLDAVQKGSDSIALDDLLDDLDILQTSYSVKQEDMATKYSFIKNGFEIEGTEWKSEEVEYEETWLSTTTKHWETLFVKIKDGCCKCGMYYTVSDNKGFYMDSSATWVETDVILCGNTITVPLTDEEKEHNYHFSYENGEFVYRNSNSSIMTEFPSYEVLKKQ